MRSQEGSFVRKPKDVKSKHYYDGYKIMAIGGVNNHPRPTEEYNCTTCPAHYNEYDPEKYPSLAESKRCRVAEEDIGYRRFTTYAEDVCELHPDTEKRKGGKK